MNSKIEILTRSFFYKYYSQQHPEAALRYFPVLNQIKKANLANSKILEIGSGSTGITPYFKKEIDAVDLNFSGPQNKLLNKIKGTASDLPFSKNSYDTSLSVDVIEHLLPELREKAIFEMVRVTKKLVIIVVPTGKLSELQDKKLQTRWNRVFSEKNLFLEEHVKYGLPRNEDILVYIDKSLRKFKKTAKVYSYPNLNLVVRKILMLTWITKYKFFYYLYLKGFLLLLPILKYCNFGKTYRHVFVIEFVS